MLAGLIHAMYKVALGLEHYPAPVWTEGPLATLPFTMMAQIDTINRVHPTDWPGHVIYNESQVKVW